MKVSFVQELSYDASFFANSQDTLNPSCCRARLCNAPVVFFQRCLILFSLQDLPLLIVCNSGHHKAKPVSRALKQTGLFPPPVLQEHYRLSSQCCNIPLRLVGSTEVRGADSSRCLFGPVIKAAKHECVWPPTNEILPTGGGHDGILWAEVCSLLVLTHISYKNSSDIDAQRCVRVCLCLSVCVCVAGELKEKLEDFVSQTNSKHPGFIKMVRHSKQEGLIRSRVSGWRAATAPVVALFDAHVEFNTGW